MIKSSLQATLFYMGICMLSFTFAYGCKETIKPSNKKAFKAMDWLLGSWEGNSEQGTVTEKWVKINDTLFAGQSFTLHGSDTLGSETISLQIGDTAILYIPLVKGQNDNKPVVFKLSYSDNTNMVFENPEHDFPQKISYQLKTEDTLIATVSGMQVGIMQSFSISMFKKIAVKPENVKNEN